VAIRLCKIAHSLRSGTLSWSVNQTLGKRVPAEWVECRAYALSVAVVYSSYSALPLLSVLGSGGITLIFNETARSLHYESLTATWPPRPSERGKEAHMSRTALAAIGLSVLMAVSEETRA